MSERYWLVHANGGRQLIDPDDFDLDRLAEQAHRVGGRLEVESFVKNPARWDFSAVTAAVFEPPASAIVPMLRRRLEQIYECRAQYVFELIERPTKRSLGNYYRSRALIRLYSHDTELGRRPLEELFATFLHEMAHHLEYTEFDRFQAKACGRKPGMMHSPLFWRILGELKGRWDDLQRASSR